MSVESLHYSNKVKYYGQLKESYPNLETTCSRCSMPYKDSDAVSYPENFSHIWCQLKGASQEKKTFNNQNSSLRTRNAFNRYVTSSSIYENILPGTRERIQYSENIRYFEPPSCRICRKNFKKGEAIANDNHARCEFRTRFRKAFDVFVKQVQPEEEEDFLPQPNFDTTRSTSLLAAFGFVALLASIYRQVRS